MSFTLWRGVVGMVRPTRRPGTLEELIRILPEGIGIVPLLLNFKAGSIAENAGRLRIAVELINADGAQIWGEQYTPTNSDLAAVQARISHDIAERIRVKLLPGEQALLSKWANTKPGAYELLLRGGAIELPHRVREEEVGRKYTHAPAHTLIALGILGRGLVGAAAAVTILMVTAPTSAHAAIAVSITDVRNKSNLSDYTGETQRLVEGLVALPRGVPQGHHSSTQ